MSRAMEDAMTAYMRRHEAASHITAILCLALPHDLREFDIEPLVKDGIPEPTYRHITALVHIIEDIVRDCRLDRASLVRELNKINEESCNEVLRCASLPKEARPHTSSPQTPASVSVMRPDVNSPITKTLPGLLKPHKHTGPYTSDFSGS